MFALKPLTILLLTLPILLAISANGKRSTFRNKPWSLSGGDYWFWAYHFSEADWPKTPISMMEFGRDAVQTMWENKPERAQAAICINSPWSVKKYDQTGGVMRISYFKRGLFTTNKVRNWDCTYIWGPDNQFYSYDDVNSDRMAWRFNETDGICSVDTATMDITCR